MKNKKSNLLNSKNGYNSNLSDEEITKICYKFFEYIDESLYINLKDFETHFRLRSNHSELDVWAHFRVEGHSLILLLKPSKFNSLCNSYKIGLLLHEVSHYMNGNHLPQFWEDYIDLYHKFDFSSIKCIKFDKNNVLEFIETDPIFKQIDHRIENLPLRRLKNLKMLDSLNKEKKEQISSNTWKRIKTETICEKRDINDLPYYIDDYYDKYNSLERALSNLNKVSKVDNENKKYIIKPIKNYAPFDEREETIIKIIKTLDKYSNSDCKVPLE